MELSEEYVSHLLLYELQSGESAVSSNRHIHIALGEGMAFERTIRVWFALVRNSNFSIKDFARLGRRSDVNNDRLQAADGIIPTENHV